MALHLILYICFFLSGAAGLLYEIYWAQRFGLLLGLDVFSHAAVLTAFMGGLALGSHVAGRRGDRAVRPWQTYARLELGIGAFGLLIPLVLPMLNAPLRWMYAATDGAPAPMTAARFVLAVGILLIPTSLMGATLPVMALAIRNEGERLGAVVGRLYALNTIGAVVGVLAGGFVLGEAIGLLGTNLTAVGLNVVAAGLAWYAGRGRTTSVDGMGVGDAGTTELRPASTGERGDGAGEQVPPLAPTSGASDMALEDDAGRGVWLVAIGAGMTGAAGMMTQIGWTRVIAFCVGSSTYAFSLIVAVFLVGLALGASAASWLVRRFRDAAVPWSAACMATSIFCWAVMLVLGGAPVRTLQLLQELVADGASAMTIYQQVGWRTFMLLALPTLALGATFPLACDAWAQRRRAGTARTTGSVYAINTIGAMLGSAMGGLVLLDAVGVQGTLHAGAILYGLAGVLGAVAARPIDARAFRLASGGLGLLTLCAGYVFGVSWDRKVFVFGPFLLQVPLEHPPVVMFYREAAAGTVAIVRERAEDIGASRDNTVLVCGGKPDASDRYDMGTQVLLGHLPMILHEEAKEAAVIGLGSGVTLRAVLTYPVQRVDVVEMSRAVVDGVHPPDGAPGPFDPVNGRCLDDPRANVIIADGRNHLALTDRTYDVIISEPSNPWMAGVAYLFTREHFENCRSRLKEGGILCQWLHSYSLPPREFLRVMQTVDEVFDSTTVWLSPSLDDYCIIATDRPRDAWTTVGRWMQRPEVAENLRSIRIESAADLFGSFLLDCATLRGKRLDSSLGVFGELEPNTDDHNELNFQAVRSFWRAGGVGAYRPLYDHTDFPRTWAASLLNGAVEDASWVRRIEDVQDAHRLMDWYQDTLKASRARAARRLGVETVAYDNIARDAFEASLKHEKPPPDEADINLSIKHARAAIAEARLASDAMVRHRRARDARMYALLAVEGDAEGGEADALLAEALLLMGRGDEARAALALAVDKGAQPDDALRRQIEAGAVSAPAPAVAAPPPGVVAPPRAGTAPPPGAP
ncbi:MAG: fused MFS/spermidine synthase [Phycisphaerales bacterium]|nr:fused MFS/spermidine synthase [Phycisphaerales bacterium]